MAVIVELRSERPGYGRILVRNFAVGGEVQFSFQRPSDHHYLGPGSQWQPNVHWHVIGGAQAEGKDSHFQVGPDIIDGLLLSSNENIRVSVQGGGTSGVGMMRIIGRLLGSDAAGSSPDTVSTSRAEDGIDDGDIIIEVPNTEEEAHRASEPPSPPSPPLPDVQAAAPTRSGKVWLWAVIVLLVLLAAVAAAWYFGLMKLPGSPDIGGSLEPIAEEVPTVAHPEPPTSKPTLKGRPRAQSYLATDERPTPQAMFDQAVAWEDEGDCEAAMIVYQMSAQADTEQAARYAHRYDPDGFSASQCINSSDAETAAYWYEGPARAGDVDAQRQLGKILVEKHSSGAMRDRGESWLRRAAQSGDETALQLIEKLGISDE